MTRLRFDSLAIKQYRGFRNLEIAHLGQVNLITGKNSVGKTALLEALRLSAATGSPRILRQLLMDRDELYRERYRRERRDAISDEEATGGTDTIDALKNLFYKRVSPINNPPSIVIGPLNKSAETLTISAVPIVEAVSKDGVPRFLRADQLRLFELESELDGGIVTSVLGLEIRLGSSVEQMYPLQRLTEGPFSDFRLPARFPTVVVSPQGLTLRELSTLWQDVALTSLQDDIVRALNIVSPLQVVDITIVGDPDGRFSRTAIARVVGLDYPLPLRSLGEGVSRAFGLALALVSARNGLLLVDEIDSGLHFTVQFEIWRFMLSIAKQLGIQVFATTHSWDCVAAFQKAISENIDVEGVLVRLERKEDDVIATLFSEDELAIATRAQIEVR